MPLALSFAIMKLQGTMPGRSSMPSKKRMPSRKDSRLHQDTDRFPAFRWEFSLYVYPKGFKPVGFNKYDDKTPPHQWIQISIPKQLT